MQLTSEQDKAYKQLTKALAACKKAGITFIALEDYHYALNGHHVAGERDVSMTEALADDEIYFDNVSMDAPHFEVPQAYASVTIAVKVKE